MKYFKTTRFGLAMIVLCLIAFASCRKRDIREVIVHVPEMKNAACARVVGLAVARMPGVDRDKVQINLEDRTVLVSYDSMILSLKNIEFAIAKAGFKANEVPADEAAARALPAECAGD